MSAEPYEIVQELPKPAKPLPSWLILIVLGPVVGVWTLAGAVADWAAGGGE